MDSDIDGLNKWEDTIENVILGTKPNNPPCLCSDIGTPPPNYEYAWGVRRPVRDRERDNIKHPCGNSLLRDKILTNYHPRTMSMWSQSEKSI